MSATTFDTSLHPRSASGRFTEKTGTDPEVAIGRRWQEIWEFEDDSVMFIERANVYHPEFKRGWLRLADGTTVGMLHWSERAGEVPCICDIEVREEHRGRGYARRLIESVEDQVGGTLHTTGSFTPEGRAALSGATPQHPGHPVPPSHRDYRSMTFVHDWDDMHAAH